ncbi:AraC family transcriptional regulator [Bosea sp. Root381]|uniref:helix-turn-helix domain-containing protein n=1 Tax=Bosea sp. Root381 TaxID=1736524 RepID=UPI001FCE0762|nr:AraC family transcriptional regulator [Bosea sp. Root381]
MSVLDPLKCRVFNGIVADLWCAQCDRDARGEYVSADPRLFIVLDRVGGEFETRLDRLRGKASPSRPGSISYLPAEVPVWGQTNESLRIRHLDLHFNPELIAERLSERLDVALLAQPRIMFENERIMALAHMIAAECAASDARHDLYGDSLALALLIELFQVRRAQPRKRSSLTPGQLRRVTDYISAHCGTNIRLQDLAALVDISQSHFSHAFKAATGLPPHQFQLQARIRRGQDMLAAGEHSLTQIAVETGFSDQAHFTRVFRKVVGETPAAWQRARRSLVA